MQIFLLTPHSLSMYNAIEDLLNEQFIDINHFIVLNGAFLLHTVNGLLCGQTT